MTPRRSLSFALCALALLSAVPALAAERVSAVNAAARRPQLDVDVWVNKDEGGVYRPGESMRIYFRTNADCYVLLYNIDTEGFIHLLYPYGPGDPPFVEGGRTFAVPSRSDPYELVADGPPGVEYVVALASPVPFRNLPWFLAGSDENGSDEGEEEAGYISGDPYVGMERLNLRIIPPGRGDDVATSETWFYIERRVEYPRYVCADCHYHQPYFDPYVSACSVVDIRIDATWIRYAPVRLGVVRPRYYYVVRSNAPTRYRQWKDQWSSRDGRAALRERFIVSHDGKARREGWMKERARSREYFDLRRSRPGRVWQGRDEVLRLRERREDVQRRRQELRDRVRDGAQRREDLRGRERDLEQQRDRQRPGERSVYRERRNESDRRDDPGRRDPPRERVERRDSQARERAEQRREQIEKKRERAEQKQERFERRDPPKERDRPEVKREDRPRGKSEDKENGSRARERRR